MSTATDDVAIPATTTDDVVIPAATTTEEAMPTATTTEEAMPTAAADEAMPTAATEEAKKKKVIILKSSDDETFEVDEAVAIKSQTIKHMIEDECADNGIPLPNVNSEILSKVIEYCKKHVEAESVLKGGEAERTMDKELRKFDAEFVKVEQAMLFELILAANYLDIKSLLDLVSQTVANMIKDKSPEEVRVIFNIKNDFTPEEEAAVRSENQWAFE